MSFQLFVANHAVWTRSLDWRILPPPYSLARVVLSLHPLPLTFILLLLLLTASCRGRCGGEYYRGYRCQCDYNCLSYGECCNDYESQCTTKNSCKGRCGENFKRGRLCSCDSDCITYNQCCPDYKDHCDTSKPTRAQEPEPTPPVEKPENSLGLRGGWCLFPRVSLLSPDDSNDTNLCSGRPVSGVTTLRNGTMVVFRGHYFWLLDSNRVPGPPRGITQEWGVPSPIDTVFTRCNCQGKTYIFKGSQYWRFENDALDPGYPKVITTGFDRLQGHITAALSVPQYKRRAESVYFFKRGGMVQKYSYQAGVRPTCGKKVQYAVYTVRNRVVRQAGNPSVYFDHVNNIQSSFTPVLGPVINIRTSWRGFPPAVTAAVSVPTTAEPEGYKYFVFSGRKSHTPHCLQSWNKSMRFGSIQTQESHILSKIYGI
uniref:Proteoglycan 4b n=1 Tax=Haplochromis burtoni TaxID=8153 RepID=A0A3Q2V9M5_HAPBU